MTQPTQKLFSSNLPTRVTFDDAGIMNIFVLHRPHRRRSTIGFTLIELLVVIVIIGILLGLLLVAVQRIREAARRTECMNHVRQIAMAAINYDSAHGELPRGVTIPGPASSISTNELFGWGTDILPFMEQGNVHDVLNPGIETLLQRAKDPDDGDNVLGVLKTPIPFFQCPSDSSAESLNLFRPGSSIIGSMATSNYVAANNVGTCYALRNPSNREAPRGAFHGIEAETMASFVDGTSNTVIFSERRYNARSSTDVDQVGAAALQFGSRGIGNPADYTTPGIQDTHFGCAGRINVFESSPHPGIARHGVSSSHLGGFMVACADGSTHFLSTDISSYFRDNPDTIRMPEREQYSTWEKLIDIQDGLIVSVDD